MKYRVTLEIDVDDENIWSTDETPMPDPGTWRWDEIIPAGVLYPHPVQVVG